MTTTLKYTLAQARDRAVSHIGTRGIPNDWWPWAANPKVDDDWENQNDCIKFVLTMLGVCTRQQQDNHFVSIAGFRAWAGWNEPAVADLRPGDIALENWSGRRDAEHAELIYSIDHKAGKITTISANTSPAPGIDMTEKNRGVAKKTRDIGAWLVAGIRPPYAGTAADITTTTRKKARTVGTWLNRHLPAGCVMSSVGDIGTVPGDGIDSPAPIYWGNIQTWGSQHDENGKPVPRGRSLYGPTFDIDRIPGNRTRAVRDVIYKLATKK